MSQASLFCSNVPTEAAKVEGFRQIDIYETRDRIYLCGRRDFNSLSSHVVEIDRAKSFEQVNLELLPTIFDDKALAALLAERKASAVIQNARAVFGVLKFATSQHLLVITKADIVAEIDCKAIFLVKDFALVPLSFRSRQTMEETRYRNMISAVEINDNFLFSYDYPLMNNWQSNVMGRGCWNDSSSPLLNERYIWNTHAGKLFVEYFEKDRIDNHRILSFLVPFTCGYCREYIVPLSDVVPSFQDNDIDSPSKSGTITKRLKYVLMARRSTQFAGSRHLRRGVNDAGDVANEVETEQIVSIEEIESKSDDHGEPALHVVSHQTASFTQIRGSIPLCWHHSNFFAPIPGIVLESDGQETFYFKRHFEALERTYGRCSHVLDLVRQTASHREHPLHMMYRASCERLQLESFRRALNYADFDLLKRGKEHLDELVEIVTQVVYETGICSAASSVLSVDSSDKLEEDGVERDTFTDDPRFQHGILRTNCVDCLDRTNLAQFLAARSALSLQLEALLLPSTIAVNGDATKEKAISMIYQQLQRPLLEVWTEHGDRIALQYAGSSAMHRMQQKEETEKKATNIDSSSKAAASKSHAPMKSLSVEHPSSVNSQSLSADVDTDEAAAATTDVGGEDNGGALSPATPVPGIGENLFSFLGLSQQIVLSALPSASPSRAASILLAEDNTQSTVEENTTESESESAPVDTKKKSAKGLSVVSNLASNALISLQRYYSNFSADFERQYGLDLLLGVPGTLPVWNRNPYPEHNRISSTTVVSSLSTRDDADAEESKYFWNHLVESGYALPFHNSFVDNLSKRKASNPFL